MALIAIGINHNTASVDIREKVAFAPDQVAPALVHIHDEDLGAEAAILSTCNRMEIYCAHEQPDPNKLIHWLAQQHAIDPKDLETCSYIHQNLDAVRHMMKVASGLDSMVLGEPQILGQMKSAYAVAQEAQTLGPELGRLFRQTFSIAKQVRTDTTIGQNPVSVAYSAVALSQRIFSDLSENVALLIGAGETIDLVARHLKQAGIKHIIVANRTLARAQKLAEDFDAEAILLESIPEYLAEADMVISSTAAPLPIVGKGMVEKALKTRKHRPMFMVDLAVPRDIEPEVSDLSDVYLYSVDDLKEIIAENLRSREAAAQQAHEIIEVGAEDFMSQLRSLNAVNTVKALRAKFEQTKQTELDKALNRIQNGDDPEKVLASFANGLTNKLVHEPTSAIRQASAEGRDEVSEWAHELFDINDLDLDK